MTRVLTAALLLTACDPDALEAHHEAWCCEADSGTPDGGCEPELHRYSVSRWAGPVGWDEADACESAGLEVYEP